MKKHIKQVSLLIFSVVLLVAGAFTTMIVGFASSYAIVTIKYYFADGETSAHDPYVAVFAKGSTMDVTVNNPIIQGYRAYDSLEEDAHQVPVTVLSGTIDADREISVYYKPDKVPYRVKYYLQNIYDDEYTETLSLPQEYYNKEGYTGTFPDELDDFDNDPHFNGFTKLYHVPDFIAADGSTEFEIYFNRNYYLIDFDLDGGFGVESIYAKYNSTFTIAVPEKEGYVFKGWALCNHDGDFIDENGNVISAEEAAAASKQFTSGIVPDKDLYYKAIWTAARVNYSVVYMFETLDEYNAVETKDGKNYSVAGAKDIIGEKFTGETVSAYDSFYEGLDSVTTEAQAQALFPTVYEDMSAAEIEQLWNKNRFDYNDSISTHDAVVLGDGTTRVYVYYDRKVYRQRFFYCRENVNETDETKKYEIAGYTKSFSMTDTEALGLTPEEGLQRHLWLHSSSPALNAWEQCVTQKPQIWSEYLNREENKVVEKRYPETGSLKDESNGKYYAYYYWEFETKYYENMHDTWLQHAFMPVPLKENYKGKNYTGQAAGFGAWSVEWNAYYPDGKWAQHATTASNRTCKGIYETLDEQLMRKDNDLNLNYLAFWTDAKNIDWNGQNWTSDPGSVNKTIYIFNYLNYVEVIPGSAEEAEIRQKIAAGDDEITQDTSDLSHNILPYTYKRYREKDGKVYKLYDDEVLETFDAGSQYQNVNTRHQKVVNEQTPTKLEGYALQKDKTESYWDRGQDENWGLNVVDVSYFYERERFNLKFRNHNVKLESDTETYYYEEGISGSHYATNDPLYPIEDLRPYYRFEGWYLSPLYLKKVDFDTYTMPDEDVTFYAKWVPATEHVEFYNDFDAYNRGEKLNEADVYYDEFVLTEDIPTLNPNSQYVLTPPTDDSTFTGWYYLDETGTPVRFEPENMTVKKSMKLYAGWTSDKTAGYKIEYVEKGTDIPVADPETGYALVSATKSFNAKSADELNSEHQTAPGEKAWWPVINSHSLLIKQNLEGEKYKPNTYAFEYFRKSKVYYRVRYIDEATREDLIDPFITDTSKALVTENYVTIPGYIPDAVTKSLVLAASAKEDPDEAEAEEIEMNTIVFIYTKNTTQALFRIDHYIQDVGGDPTDRSRYSHYRTETYVTDINQPIDVEAQVYGSRIAQSLDGKGYILKKDLTLVNDTAIAEYLAQHTEIIADGNTLVFKVYYLREKFPYKVIYVDWDQERLHDEDPNVDDGILRTIIYKDDDMQPIGAAVTINAPQTLTIGKTEYKYISGAEQPLMINYEEFDPNDPDPQINVRKVYYRQKVKITINYVKVCEGAIDPDFAYLSSNRDIAAAKEEILGSTAIDNDSYPGRYVFLGWYKTPEPTQDNLLTTERFFKPDELPENNTTYYAVFKMVKVPYKLVYRFKPRVENEYVDSEGYNSYVVVGKEILEGDFPDYIDMTGDVTKLTNEFVLSNAPYESNFGKIVKWDEDNIEQKIEDGVLIATLTAEQDDKPVYVYYRLTPDGPYDKTIKTSRGANRAIDPQISALLAADTYGGKQFSYWAIRKSADDNAEIVAKCYDAHFTYCIMDDYYITPVYDGAASPVDDGELITLTHLQYTRNRWTTADGVVNLNGSTDLLYTDFEIAFTDKGQRIYGDGTGYTVGVEYELCGQLDEGDTFGEKYQHYESDEAALAQAIGNNKSSYTFSPEAGGTVKRNLMKGVIPNAKLTNKNRVEYAKAFKNAYSEAKHSYTNSTYIMKAYAFMIDSSGNVTLSDPVYICLNGIANVNLATDSGDGSCIITDN